MASKQQRSASNDALRNLACGSVAGMVSQAVCHPIDTMRTRLQTAQPRFESLRHCVQYTARNEGIRGFYKGMQTPFLAQGVYKAVIFSVQGATLRALTAANNSSDNSSSKDAGARAPAMAHVCASGAVAGAANSIVVTPVEFVRNRLQMQYGNTTGAKARYAGPLDVVRQTVAGRGARTLFTGLPATMARDGPGMALFFLAFDTAKRAIAARQGPDQPLQLAHTVMAASCAGIAFWSWALPVDTVKSVVQSPGNEGRSIRSVLAEMYRTGGTPRFFRGWQAAFVRGIPGATSTLVTHTYLSKLWAQSF